MAAGGPPTPPTPPTPDQTREQIRGLALTIARSKLAEMTGSASERREQLTQLKILMGEQ